MLLVFGLRDVMCVRVIQTWMEQRISRVIYKREICPRTSAENSFMTLLEDNAGFKRVKSGHCLTSE